MPLTPTSASCSSTRPTAGPATSDPTSRRRGTLSAPSGVPRTKPGGALSVDPPDRHEWLDYPDGSVVDLPAEDLVADIWEVLREERPTVVCTFGPDGIFGHPDHIAVGAATDAAFARGVADGGPGFQRLIHGVIPQSVFERWNAQRAALGLTVFDPTAMYHMRGVPDRTIDITVDTSSVAHRTVAGLLEHRSQHHVIFDPPIDAERWQRVVTREWHTIAWPLREHSAHRFTDVFDGLD